MTPLELPGTGLSLQEFEVQRVDFAAPEASGTIGGVQSGFPLWLAVWTVGTIGARRSDVLQAWTNRLRGSQRRFLGRDLSRPFPLRHICGFAGMRHIDGTPFTGAASGWSQAIDGDGNAILTLHGLPPGLILSVKDYVDFRWAATSSAFAGVPWRAIVRVVCAPDGSCSADTGFAAMANAAGDISVMIEPTISPAVPGGAVAHLDRPACTMVSVSDKTKLDAIDRRLAVRGGSIVGVQDLRP